MAKIACCHNCAYSYWDRDHTVQCMTLGVMNWPACANHPESLGRMRRVPQRGICVNYRAKVGKPEGDVKQIPLGGGVYAYVDAADYEWLSQWTWHLHGGYAARRTGREVIFMHRQIMQPPKGMVVDHKNRNKRDNTRANLWNCTPAENALNRDRPRDASSRFMGVGYEKSCRRYYARLYHERKSLFIGYYVDELDAARAYDRKAVEVLGKAARLNFPEEWSPRRRAAVHARFQASLKREGKKGRKAKKEEGKKVGRKEGKTSRRSPPRPRRTGSKPRRS